MVALYEGWFVVTGADAERFRDADVWREAHRSPLGLEASRPGVFAVGDVRHSLVKRVASALGEGAMAVRFVHEHLSQEA
jgi:thioredoxin reductase (NADPH)